MTTSDPIHAEHVPKGFGSSARSVAFFPILMGGYAIFYSVWWPFAWGWTGAAAFLIVLIGGLFAIFRGVTQVRHAARFASEPNPDNDRLNKAMGLLNGVTHPLWIVGSVLLLVFGQGRWVLPLMVFVIGAHFIPMAAILGRKVDYVLGPVAVAGALVAAWLAADPQIPWLVVFAVAGLGGAISTLSYAGYMARSYRKLCSDAGVRFPVALSG